MRVLDFMEDLLAFESEAKHLFAASDPAEQAFMPELSRIFKEAEVLFGPRDTSYRLSVPRITECVTARSHAFWPLRTSRIYLSRGSRTTPWLASVELAHEAIHVLSPGLFVAAPTILEEGLCEWFAQRYASRVHGIVFDRGAYPKFDAVMQSVSTLLANNKFVIRDLRTRQPVLSRIDEKLLVEVARIEPEHAKFLCSDFQSYWKPTPFNKLTAQGAKSVAACLHAIWSSATRVNP